MTDKTNTTSAGGWDQPESHPVEIDSETRVLLVGPSTDLIDELADLLREIGCSVQTSWHAADALFLLGTAHQTGTPLHFVFADEALSGVDAHMFATLVHEDERFASIRLLLLERKIDEHHAGCASAEFDGRIGPDLEIPSLTKAIDDLVSGSPAASAAGERATAVTDCAARKGPSILVVEDNPINLEVACELIQRIGYPCDSAVNGHEAVVAVKRFSYDLVLMDCQLPGMDGYEATDRIRVWEESRTRGRRVPIVALTAHAMTGDRDRCLTAGMDDYMTKPVDARKLEAMIVKWIAPTGASDQDSRGHEKPSRVR